MSRWYALLAAVLAVGGMLALVLQAWVLGSALLLVGGGGLLAELRQRRRPGRVPMSGRLGAKDNEVLKAEVRAAQQFRDAQGWAGGGGY